tara:strand:+ start:324 stop:515 length:192 start_codon:yes stop_codon:yes gene_type:complete
MPYIVWVGGIDDHYKTKEEAEEAVEKWKSKGYDDVQLEFVSKPFLKSHVKFYRNKEDNNAMQL